LDYGSRSKWLSVDSVYLQMASGSVFSRTAVSPAGQTLLSRDMVWIEVLTDTNRE
jgi:hypothetical protein